MSLVENVVLSSGLWRFWTCQSRSTYDLEIFQGCCVQSKKGGSKNVTCTVCDKTLTGCRSSLALAHILGRPVLERSKVNFRFCVPPIREDDNHWYAQFKTAQKVLNKQVMTKEAQLSSSKSSQTVLDLTSPGKRTVTEEMNTVQSKTLDSAIANVF